MANIGHFCPKLLGDILTFKNGKSIKPGGIGEYPVYGSNGIIGGCDEYKEQNGIILGRVGAHCGSVSYYSGKFWASDNTIVVYPKSTDYDVLFLSYFLRELNLNRWAGGAAQPLLTQNVLKSVEASVPPLPTQRKIAFVLSAYDDLIENNLRRIKILEDMAQSIYREWFVKFRFPGHERARFVDSQLGRIPEGWQIVNLGSVIELAYGKALTKNNRVEGSVPVFGSSGIIGYHRNSLVKGPGIIVGRKGNVGKVYWSSSDFFPIDTVFYVKTKIGSLQYVFYNLLDQHFIDSSAAVPGLSRDQAYHLSFLVPDDLTLNKFQTFIDPIFKHLDDLKARNKNLCSTFNLLLPRLISGEVDVSEFQITVTEEVNA